MGAVRTVVMVEGNLARDPRFWESDGRRPAFLSFTVMHTARIRDESGAWVDGRTTSVDVTFSGPSAERMHDRMEAAPGVLVKGAAVVAFGDVGRARVSAPASVSQRVETVTVDAADDADDFDPWVDD
ncbi:single-stranded DNA-binding protein [Bifidobacterium callimiconis]|uniref:Single-stranded DNA-binding protein n=1 Tax=Bifidobacterium callimiconis TaxID=2306973 RepID=A0A430FEK4_9BIFI|nr:single-stranded DNA-binding protein [Bifidobacterium callimiconis]RSX51283.1 hypothetical protein D2E23_1128 [Bifidobacterium callimiconis]